MKITALFTLLLFSLFSCIHDGTPDDARHQRDHTGNPAPGDDPDSGGDPEPAGPLVDLKYAFQAGQILNYRNSEEMIMSVKMASPGGMPGMMPGMVPPGVAAAMQFHVLTETGFRLTITEVYPDGSAGFILSVNDFKSYMMPGKTLMASHEGLAKDALEVKGTISPKGRVVFHDEVFLVVTEKNEKFYVRARGNGHSVSGEASDGETTVSVFAQYDPKTGRVTGGAKTTVKSPKKTVATIKVSENDRRVDVLPKQIMEMFELPENPVRVNQTIGMRFPGASLGFQVTSYDNDIAHLRVSFDADTSEMARMGGEEVPQEGMPQMSGTVDGRFSVARGLLEHVAGKTVTRIQAGMEVEISTTFLLQLQ